MASKLRQIQEEVEKALEGKLPEGVVLMSRRRGHIANNITAALAQKQIVVMVFPPIIDGIKGNVRDILAEKMSILVSVMEMPTLNGTSTNAYELTELVMTTLHQMRICDNSIILACSDVSSGDPADTNAVEFDLEFGFQATFKKQI